MFDLKNNLKTVQSVAPQTLTADANGTGADLKGFGSALVVFSFGASGDTLSTSVKIAGVVQESDDDSTYTDVADADLLGTEPLVDDPAEDVAIAKVGYIGTKRYIRAKFDLTGTHTNGIPVSATIVLGDAADKPVA